MSQKKRPDFGAL